MPRFLTSVIAAAMAACSPAAAEQEKTSSPVPAEFQSLISKDAKFVFFMKNPARVMNEAKSLGIVKELPPTTLSKGMELPFTSEKPIQADQFFIGWSNEFPQLFEEPVMHLATRIPADQVNKLKPKKDFSIEYVGDIAIFTTSPNQTWKKPEETSNPMLTALPDMDIAAALDGDKMGEMMSSNVQEFLYTLPMMFESRMKEYAKGAAKYADPVVSKAIQGATKDFQDLIGEVLPTVRTADTLTAGINFRADTLDLDVVMHLKEDMPPSDAFDDHLVDQLPPGLPVYLALNGQAARWISLIEFDVLEGFLMNKADQVAKFDALKTQWGKMVKQIKGGITVGMSLNTAYQWSNIQVDDGAAFMAACNAVMGDLGTLGVGIKTKPSGTNSWQMEIDGKEIASLMGGPQAEQQAIAEQYGGSYGTSAVRSGNLVMAKQYPIDAAKFPMDAQDQSLFKRLKTSDSERMIVGIAADLGLMIQQDFLKQMKREKANPKAMKTLQATLPKGLIALHINLNRVDDRQIGLAVDFPLAQAIEYSKTLSNVSKPEPKKMKTESGNSPKVDSKENLKLN